MHKTGILEKCSYAHLFEWDAYSRSITIALAAPPPLHTAATPFSPDLSAWMSVQTIRHPEDPIGYSSAPLL